MTDFELGKISDGIPLLAVAEVSALVLKKEYNGPDFIQTGQQG